MNKAYPLLTVILFMVAMPIAVVDSLCQPLTVAKDIAIVANPGVPADELSLADVRQIFLADRRYWSRKLRITVLLRAPGSWERKVMLETVFLMSESQFQRYWVGKVFRAEIPVAPQTVYSSWTAARLAASIPGAITFVDASQVPLGLKILKVLKANLKDEPSYSRRPYKSSQPLN